jgi:hypothetical protein
MNTPEAVIQNHLSLCDEAFSILMEENRILRATGQPPAEAFLKKKRALLPKLDTSIESLKQLRENGPSAGENTRNRILEAQKKLMKIFLLDRENEQLLLKTTLVERKNSLAPAVFRHRNGSSG